MMPHSDVDSALLHALQQAGPEGASVDELLHVLTSGASALSLTRADLRKLLRDQTRSGAIVRMGRDLFGAPVAQRGSVGRLKLVGPRYLVETEEGRFIVDDHNLAGAIAGDVVRVVPSDTARKGISRGIVTEVLDAAPREVFAIVRRQGRYFIGTSPRIDEPILVVDERARMGGVQLVITGRAASRRRVRVGLPMAPLVARIATGTRAESSERPQHRSGEAEPERAARVPGRLTASEAYRYLRRGELNASALLDQLAHGTGVDRDFPPEAIAQAAAMSEPTEPGVEDTDLRDEPLVTIDGATAKDFDDAVAARIQGRFVELLVAIADVSHYVQPDGALDVEARQRGCSVYLPGRVYPMLPERLSNVLCSLQPHVTRRCAWVRMRIDPAGDVSWYDLGFGLMRSRARLTYEQVEAHLQGSAPIEDEAIAASLAALEQARARLLKRRQERGMLDLELPEALVALTEDGAGVQAVQTAPRLTSHRLIEECMLVTNETVADFLASRSFPCIYRSHDEPDADRLEQARQFIAGLAGVTLDERRALRPIEELSSLVEAVRGHDAERIANLTILRALPKASYAVSTRGHFGIGATRYAHFTSPIRRYADLEVHRMLRLALASGSSDASLMRRAQVRLEESASASNEGEQRADGSERFAQRLLKARYMMDHIGERFEVVVTGVQRYGAFASITEGDIEGLIHISEFGEYMSFHEQSETLRGVRSRRVVALGDRMEVVCSRVVLTEARIDFVPVPKEVEDSGDPEGAVSEEAEVVVGPGNA